MRRLVHYFRKENGASSAEFALVFLPFSALVLGIISLSTVLYANQTLQFATEAAARYYSVSMANGTDVSASINNPGTYVQDNFYRGPMATQFTASRGGCGPNGFQVYGTGSITLSAVVVNTTITLQAHACFP